MYQKVEFGCDGKAFVRLQLSSGGTLGYLLCRLPLELGRLTAFLPPHARLWELMHFGLPLNTLTRHQQEGIDGEYRTREREALRQIVNSGGRAALFRRDTIAPGVDRHFRVHAGRIYRHMIVHRRTEAEIVQSTERYHLLSGPDISEDVWGDAYYNARGGRFGLIGVIGCFSAQLSAEAENEVICRSTLQAVAERSELILISAFDLDATLIWSRTG